MYFVDYLFVCVVLFSLFYVVFSGIISGICVRSIDFAVVWWSPAPPSFLCCIGKLQFRACFSVLGSDEFKFCIATKIFIYEEAYELLGR